MFTVFLIVAVLAFHFGGLLGDRASLTGYTLDNLGLTNPENFGSTSFYVTIGLIAALSVGGGIIGSLFRISPESILMITIGVPLTTILIAMGWDIILIFNELQKTNTAFATIVCSPLIFSWFFTIYDYFRGRD